MKEKWLTFVEFLANFFDSVEKMRAASCEHLYMCLEDMFVDWRWEWLLWEQLEEMNFSSGRVRFSSERRRMGRDKDCRRRAQMECKWFGEYDWHSGVYETSEYNISSVWCTVQTQTKPLMTRASRDLDRTKQNPASERKERKSLSPGISQIMSKGKKHVLSALKVFWIVSISVISNNHPLIHSHVLKISLFTIILNPWFFSLLLL